MDVQAEDVSQAWPASMHGAGVVGEKPVAISILDSSFGLLGTGGTSESFALPLLGPR